jgi:cold shock protein
MRRDRPRRSSGDSRYSFDEPRNSFAEPHRDRDFDRPRRSFDQPAPMATNVQATVKWFNATKGFGFVTPTDGTQDAFLHASQLAFLGHEELPEGATVVVDLAQGPKGPQVSAVHEVDVSTATPSGSRDRAPRDFGGPRGGGRDFGAPRGGGGGFSRDRDSGPTEEVLGTVKWYNPDKGFGFIGPDNGGKDIFVHASALQRSGLYDLTEGAAVRVQVRQGQKGLEAASIELA